MVRVRVGTKELRFPEEEWEAHVSEGRVPPDALVFSLQVSDGLWPPAARLPLYDFFRRTGEADRREAGRDPGARPFADLLAIAFPRRGWSATELLLALNLLAAGALLLLWRDAYPRAIWALAWDLHELLVGRGNPIGVAATLFLHADLRHLGANLISLLPSAAFVEYLYGRRVLIVYLLGGLAGAAASFWLKGHGPLSIGASGAVYALMGAFGGFVLRHIGRLPRWHRWRARRIYLPGLLVVVLPSLLHADWRAHVGGLVAGLALGWWLPPHARGRAMLLRRRGEPAPERQGWSTTASPSSTSEASTRT